MTAANGRPGADPERQSAPCAASDGPRARGAGGVAVKLVHLYILRHNVPYKVHDDGSGKSTENLADLFPRVDGRRAGARVVPEGERHAIGKDLMRAQWQWPVGMPFSRPLGNGLWEIRTDLPTKRTARVLRCHYHGHLVALHGFIKKTRATPDVI